MSGAICLHCSYTLAFFLFLVLFLVLFLFWNSQLNSTTMQNQGCQLQFPSHLLNAQLCPRRAALALIRSRDIIQL